MGTALGRTLEQIGMPKSKNRRKGIFIGNCKVCGLMLTSFDVQKDKTVKCPVCQ